MAGPNLLTAECAVALIAQRRLGKSTQVAASSVGVSRQSVQNWLAKGTRQPHTLFGAFAEAWALAYGDFVRENTEVMARTLFEPHHAECNLEIDNELERV